MTTSDLLLSQADLERHELFDELPPFEVAVFDGDFAPLDWVAEWESLEVVLEWRADTPSTATIVLAADDDAVNVLTTPGARVVIGYRYDPQNPRELRRLLNGPVTVRQGEQTDEAQTRTFDVIDDVDVVLGMLGWPNPSGTIDQQGAASAYWRRTGPAETVLKAAVSANVGRLGLPLTVAPDLGRGSTISVAIRMHPLRERLWPKFATSGLGVVVEQQGTGLVLDVVEPPTIPHKLTQASGVVAGGKFSITPPTATRAVVMGQGEGTARLMAYVVDAAAEARWGKAFRREVPVDARSNAGTVADLEADGWAALAEHAERAAVSADLAETEDFRMFVVADLGDPVEVILNGTPAIEDRIVRVTLKDDVESGLTVTPHVGEVIDDPDATTIDAVAQVSREVRDVNVRS